MALPGPLETPRTPGYLTLAEATEALEEAPRHTAFPEEST